MCCKKPMILVIAGPNGSGKSTLISCASTVFYQMPMNEFFGYPENSEIKFELDNKNKISIYV